MGWETGDIYWVENNGLDLAYCWDSHSSRVITIRPAFPNSTLLRSCLWTSGHLNWQHGSSKLLVPTPGWPFCSRSQIAISIAPSRRSINFSGLLKSCDVRASRRSTDTGRTCTKSKLVSTKILQRIGQCHLRLKWANQWTRNSRPRRFWHIGPLCIAY